jgi:hypothetical protein
LGGFLELHVVFSYSARVDLRKALGPDAAIARFSDDLGYGPINPLDAVTRRAWTDTYQGYDNPDITEDDQTFWPLVLDPNASRVAWFSRRNAREYCGFLEYLRRLNGLSTDIIDVTDAKYDDDSFFPSMATIPATYILGAGLQKRRHRLAADTCSEFVMLWERLRTENSELRVLNQSLSLSSTSIDHYDDHLLALAGDDWRSMALIVTDALDYLWVGDLFLMSRLYALVDDGKLALRETGRRHPDLKRVQP